VEAGWKGFWRDYPNLVRLLEELELEETEALTDWTTSSLFSPEGIEVTAPSSLGRR